MGSSQRTRPQRLRPNTRSRTGASHVYPHSRLIKEDPKLSNRTAPRRSILAADLLPPSEILDAYLRARPNFMNDPPRLSGWSTPIRKLLEAVEERRSRSDLGDIDVR